MSIYYQVCSALDNCEGALEEAVPDLEPKVEFQARNGMARHCQNLYCHGIKIVWLSNSCHCHNFKSIKCHGHGIIIMRTQYFYKSITYISEQY
jgi:hypothetical protein